MIQGLLTRPLTDEVVKPFVESAKGTLHSDGPNFDTVNFSGDIACFVWPYGVPYNRYFTLLTGLKTWPCRFLLEHFL